MSGRSHLRLLYMGRWGGHFVQMMLVLWSILTSQKFTAMLASPRCVRPPLWRLHSVLHHTVASCCGDMFLVLWPPEHRPRRFVASVQQHVPGRCEWHPRWCHGCRGRRRGGNTFLEPCHDPRGHVVVLGGARLLATPGMCFAFPRSVLFVPSPYSVVSQRLVCLAVWPRACHGGLSPWLNACPPSPTVHVRSYPYAPGFLKAVHGLIQAWWNRGGHLPTLSSSSSGSMSRLVDAATRARSVPKRLPTATPRSQRLAGRLMRKATWMTHFRVFWLSQRRHVACGGAPPTSFRPKMDVNDEE